jgi:Protein of unknown function (DUF4435)
MSHVIVDLPEELSYLLRRIGNARVLLLEGESDHGVFKIWYRDYYDQGALVFYVAGQKRFVREYVQGALAYTNAVFGIVDRDYTERENWKSDPEPNVFQLQNHELENYLIAPEAIREAISIQNSPQEPPSIAIINEQIQNWANESVLYSAGNWLIQEYNQKRGEFGERTFPEGSAEPRSSVIRRLADAMQCSESEAEEQLKIKERQVQIEVDHISQLHVWIEGKRLLHKLQKAYFATVKDTKLSNQLADILKRQGIPKEINDIVEKQVMGRSVSTAESRVE